MSDSTLLQRIGDGVKRTVAGAVSGGVRGVLVGGVVGTVAVAGGALVVASGLGAVGVAIAPLLGGGGTFAAGSVAAAWSGVSISAGCTAAAAAAGTGAAAGAALGGVIDAAAGGLVGAQCEYGAGLNEVASSAFRGAGELDNVVVGAVAIAAAGLVLSGDKGCGPLAQVFADAQRQRETRRTRDDSKAAAALPAFPTRPAGALEMLALTEAEGKSLASEWRTIKSSHSAASVDDIVKEIRMNGYGASLTTEKGLSLIDVAREELKKTPGVSEAEMLSVLCYTGTKVEGDLRLSMLKGNLQRWPVVSATLDSAIQKLSSMQEPVDKYEILYHGLHNITLSDLKKYLVRSPLGDGLVEHFELAMPAPLSTTRSKKVAIDFATGMGGTVDPSQLTDKGMILRIHNPSSKHGASMRADVSPISHYKGEKEVVIRPFKQFQLSTETTWTQYNCKDGRWVDIDVIDCYL